MKKRNPIIRKFLKKYYEQISLLLIAFAIFIIAGIAGWIIDTNNSLLPHHIPMIILSVVMIIIGNGLIRIYEEE